LPAGGFPGVWPNTTACNVAEADEGLHPKAGLRAPVVGVDGEEPAGGVSDPEGPPGIKRHPQRHAPEPRPQLRRAKGRRGAWGVGRGAWGGGHIGIVGPGPMGDRWKYQMEDLVCTKKIRFEIEQQPAARINISWSEHQPMIPKTKTCKKLKNFSQTNKCMAESRNG